MSKRFRNSSGVLHFLISFATLAHCVAAATTTTTTTTAVIADAVAAIICCLPACLHASLHACMHAFLGRCAGYMFFIVTYLSTFHVYQDWLMKYILEELME
jgi:hypothetical protein